MGTSDQLRSAWTVLESEAWTNPGVYERRLPGAGAHAIHALLVRPGGSIGLALDVSPEVGAAVTEDSARGFALTKRWIQESGRTRISLTLTERRYLEVFGVLACDVADKIARSDTAEKGCMALVNRVAHWKKFLRAVGDEGLSVERQTGLYGELLVLRSLLERNESDPGAAISSWLGPTGANQDFARQGRMSEVKSTIADDFSRVRVSSERQLDESGLASLLLCQLIFDRIEGNGSTLPHIVVGLMSALDEDLRDVLTDKLTLAGYHQMHESRYLSHGYTLRACRVFRVGEGFPRIRQGDLPSGVAEVSYSADLANIDPVSDSLEFVANDIFQEQVSP